MTLGTFPLHVIIDHDLTIIATYLTVIGFGIELSVLDIVIDEADHFLDGFHIIGQVRHFHIRDSSAQRLILELTLNLKFCKCVDFLTYIHMIRICIVSFIGDIGNITVFFTVDPCKTVAKCLCGSSVETESNAGLLFPFCAAILHVIHDAQGEFLAGLHSLAAALHQIGHLIQSDISQRHGGITVVQVFVDGLTLLQTGDGAVLPVDGAHIGYHALQCLMTAHQCFIAQLQTLIQQFPELLLISFCQDTDLGQVDADNALIKTAFPLVLSVFILPWRQEGTAAHAGKYIALVVLTHLLGRDIVGVHSLSRALCGQLGHIVVFSAL